jgi:hypothetical protein
MLTFNSLAINDVDLCREMLTSVLTFKSLVINIVDLVDLYMRYLHYSLMLLCVLCMRDASPFAAVHFGHLW